MRHLRLALSTPWTPVFKFGFPVLAAGAPVAAAVAYARDPAAVPVQVVAMAGAAALLVLCYCAGLKAVHQEGHTLIISNYFREIRVPAERIERVTRFWWLRPGAVTVRFGEPTPFGRTIGFAPEGGLLSTLGFGPLDQEPVRHLRRLAGGGPRRHPSA